MWRNGWQPLDPDSGQEARAGTWEPAGRTGQSPRDGPWTLELGVVFVLQS